MIPFRCVAMPTAVAERFRQTGQDDGGNPLRRVSADQPSPCRHCLRDAGPGETVLLGSFRFGRPEGLYWAPSPVWVHSDLCDRFDANDEVAPIVRAGSSRCAPMTAKT